MRYHTKEYYKLFMALDLAEMYEPVIDKAYSDEEIEELYQRAVDEYIEEERADYDAPPELIFGEDDEAGPVMINDQLLVLAAADYENRPPFDEEAAREEFEEMYRDNLEEPDEDLPDWVREAVDPRILAMYRMPEKIYERLSAEDEQNEERFDELDEAADEALDANLESLPENYQRFADVLDDLEDAIVTDARIADGCLSLSFADWDDEGEEVFIRLSFADPEFTEDEGISVETWEDEDGDTDSDCELVYSELYKEGGRPEVHMLFDNNGLKYLTFSCSGAVVYDGSGNETASI